MKYNDTDINGSDIPVIKSDINMTVNADRIIKSPALTAEGKELTEAPVRADTGVNVKIKNHSIKSKRKTSFPIGVVFMVIVFTLFLMMCVSNYVALNEYTRDIADLKNELADLRTEEKELEGELDKKNDLIEIEKYATEELGMVGSNNVDKMYIEITEDEKIEVYEVEEDGTMGQIASALFALTGNLIDSWNTFMGNE